MKAIHLQTVDDLRRVTDQWNDLWFYSDVTDPTGRAECIALWIEQFAPQRRFHALVIEESGSFLAAFPLIENRVQGILKVGAVPGGGWAHGGGLLLRKSHDVDHVLTLFVDSLRSLPWQLLWLECVRVSSEAYRYLLESMSARAMPYLTTPQYEIAIISTDNQSWDEYWQTLGPSLRSNLRQQARRFVDKHLATYKRFANGTPQQISRLVEEVFRVEDRSWKGANGSSVIKRGLLSFYQQQALELAKAGYLAIRTLQVNDCPVAFEYGYMAKNVFHACKSGYDPEYRKLSPGQVLRYHILQELFADDECVAYDCIGELTANLAKWQPTARSQTGHIIVATNGMVGRSVLHLKKHYWPWLKRMRRRGLVSSRPDNPASRY